MDILFPLAVKTIEADFGGDLTLVRSATTLTLQGYIDDDEDDEEENDGDEGISKGEDKISVVTEGGDDDNDDDEEDEDEDDEDEELGSFEYKNREFCIIKVGMPLLIIGRQSEPSEEAPYIILDGDENDRISALIQDELDKQFDVKVE